MLQRLFLPLILLCMSAAARAQEVVTIEQVRALVREGRHAEALDLMEPMLEQKIDLGKARSRPSEELPIVIPLEEYMAGQYIAGHLEERGATFLYRLYTAGIEHGKPAARDLEEQLIGLALAAGKLDIAAAVVDEQKKRKDDPEWELSQARVDAARGRAGEALAALRSYLDKDSGQSRSRILVLPAFAPLYGNASFRDMMTESEDLARRRYERFKPRDADDSTPPPAAEVLATAALYAEVRDEKGSREINEKLRAADRIVALHAGRYREELFASLAGMRGSPYYRLTVGRMLAALGDTALARRVAAEVVAQGTGDDFIAFPQQLVSLAYGIARLDPGAARPLLRQVLKCTGEKRSPTGYVTTLDWDLLLVQAFGVAGDVGMDELEATAAGSDSVAGANAVRILGSFFDPRLVHVMMKKLDATTLPAERKRIIDRLSSVYLPETIKALEGLQARGGSSSEMLAVRVGLKSLRRPAMPLPDRHGVAIADRAIMEIILHNVELTNGDDVSHLDKTLLLSATKADIPALERIRRGIFLRFSEESLYDIQAINAIILWLRWQ